VAILRRMGEEGEGQGEIGDPFDGLRLDDGFVAAAVHREASAAERARRPEPRPAPAGRGPARRGRGAGRARRRAARSPGRRLTLLAGALFVLVVGSALVVDQLDPEPPVAGPVWRSGAPSWAAGATDGERPSPSGSTDRRRAPVTADEDDAHAFVQTDPRTGAPVAWDPCRPVPVVISAEGRPAGAEDLVLDALAEVGRLTGLDLVLEGPTDEVPADDRPPLQRDRYGDRWAPVLVAWTDASTIPGLAGDVAGLGGSVSAARPSGEQVYVSGVVLLDRPDLDAVGAEVGAASVRAVLLHELGHVLGLDHVDDRDQLMYPEGRTEVTTYGPGDRAGLARLGQGPCAPDL
jgi:hypothetical protein